MCRISFNMLSLFFLVTILSFAQSTIIHGPRGPHLTSHEVTTLVDESRWDPYAPDNSPHKRHILVSVFTPVEGHDCELETIPYFPPSTADTYAVVAESIGLPSSLFEGFSLEFCQAAPDDRHKWPVVIFSPGFSTSRLLYSAQAQSLASQGYLVITMDYPYEATVVEFPDGEVIYGFNVSDVSDEIVEMAVKVRSEDVSFLIDQISPKSNVHSRRTAPDIFVFGHSLGGATAAQTALEDDRILGGLNFDGAIEGTVADEGLDKPFFVVSKPTPNDTAHPFQGFMDKLRGPKMLLDIEGTTHLSYTDMPLLVEHSDNIPEEQIPGIQKVLGSINGERMSIVMDEIVGRVSSFVFKNDNRSLCCITEEFGEILVPDQDGVCRE